VRRRLTPVLALFLPALVGAGVLAAHGPGHYDLIVPGEGIGDARLGMSESALAAVNVRAGCRVTASFTEDQAVRLATSVGGACTTRGGTQVGMHLGSIVAEFGRPDAIRPDAMYPHAVAVWQEYLAAGIGFRVLIFPDRSTLIQAISVFPREARRP
jgi:hypothetical protein